MNGITDQNNKRKKDETKITRLLGHDNDRTYSINGIQKNYEQERTRRNKCE